MFTLRSILVALPLALSSPAFCADFFVDSSHGSDFSGDGSQAAPWRTIGYSLSVIPAPLAGASHRLVLSAGRYDQASGESFPIVLRDGVELRSRAGSAATRVVAPPFVHSIFIASYSGDFRVRGLTLHGSLWPIWAEFDAARPAQLVLSDLDVLEASWNGLHVTALVGARARIELDRVRVRSRGGTTVAGILVHSVDAEVALLARESSVIGADDGLVLGGLGLTGSALSAKLDRCRFEGCRDDGIYAHVNSLSTLSLRADRCSLSFNTRGLYVNGPGDPDTGGLDLELRYCTLADNAANAIRMLAPPGSTQRRLAVHGCILDGTQEDLYAQAGHPELTVAWSIVDSGTFVDRGNNLSVEPGFAALHTGDWQLAASSACIDAGDPRDGTDPDGSLRDLGAYPFDATARPASALYCTTSPNSVGPGARLEPRGNLLHALNDFRLRVTGAPPNTAGLFFFGGQPQNLPFQDGVLCVGGALQRLPLQTVTASGWTSRDLDLAAPAPGLLAIAPDSTWYFQFWYRDPNAGGSGTNLSDAMRVRFVD